MKEIKELAEMQRQSRKHGPITGGVFGFLNPHSETSLRFSGAESFPNGKNPFCEKSIAWNCWNVGFMAAKRHFLRESINHKLTTK